MLKSYCFLLLSCICLESIGQSLPSDNRIKLGSTINTNGDEGGSLISRDGNTLVFIRGVSVKGNAEQQDVFVARKNQDGTWGQATSVGAPINNDEEDNTCAGIGTDNNTLYLINLVRTKRSLNRGISVSRFDGTAWSAPQPLSIPAKIPAIGFFSAYVAPDESYVIISAAIQGSKGEEDLFVCPKKADGAWGDLIHMGDQINSRGYETTPFLSADGKTLYFASNGHGGLGDADIFRSKRTGESWTSWSMPENLGPKINTAGFDASLSVDNQGNAYFTSGEGSNPGPGDLYGMNITNLVTTPPQARDTTRQVVTNPPPATDSAAIANAQPRSDQSPAPGSKGGTETGKNNAVATGGNETGATGGTSATGKAGTSGRNTGSNQAGAGTAGRDGSKSGSTGTSGVDSETSMPKAYFETNSSVLSDEYKDEILTAVKGALSGRTAYITIYGFADNVGTNAYNLSLSRRRAQAVRNALVQSGTQASRIKVRGFGEGNPAADNSTEDGRKLNRRVEIHLSK